VAAVDRESVGAFRVGSRPASTVWEVKVALVVPAVRVVVVSTFVERLERC
jgi:hypothetical protein